MSSCSCVRNNLIRWLYGIDLMNELTRDYGLRGIALSGYGMDEDLARTKNAGFIAHLVKPVDVDRLNAVLEQAAPASYAFGCGPSTPASPQHRSPPSPCLSLAHRTPAESR